MKQEHSPCQWYHKLPNIISCVVQISQAELKDLIHGRALRKMIENEEAIKQCALHH